MAEWKKIVVSGSAISQLNNDAGYITSIGTSIDSASHAEVADAVTFAAVSSSAQINLGSATGTAANATSASHAEVADAVTFAAVSSSAQINLASATGTAANATSASRAVSAASADSAAVASSVDFANVADKPTLVSGSAQINLGSATGTAANATTAATASYVAASNVSGTVANATSASRAVSAASADQALSAQSADEVAYGDITGLPALVSGSAQINLGSATGTAASATSASHAETADAVTFAAVSSSAQINLGSATGTAASATSASHAEIADLALQVAGGNVSGSVASATSASHAETADAISANATGTNLTLSGNLTVNGTTVTVNTANLEVEDRFIFLNEGSGSAAPAGEGGIIVEGGTAGSGSAFYYDGNSSRWSVASNVAKTATSVTAAGFASVVFLGTGAEATSAGFNQAGNIAINDADIFIYDNA